MDLKKEDYLIRAKITTKCRVVFLHSFISALFLYFFQVHLQVKWSFAETFFPSFGSFLWGFLNQLPNTCIRQTHLFCWRQTVLAMKINKFRAGDKHCSAGDKHVETCVQTSATPHTQQATNEFQTDLMLRWLLPTGAHLRTWVVSCCCTHLWVCYTHKLYIHNCVLCRTKWPSSRLNW